MFLTAVNVSLYVLTIMFVPLMLTGARLRSTFDFGLVTLDIMSLRGDDSGIYTCRALNLMGEAVSTCTLKVEGRLSCATYSCGKLDLQVWRKVE